VTNLLNRNTYTQRNKHINSLQMHYKYEQNIPKYNYQCRFLWSANFLLNWALDYEHLWAIRN